MASPFVQVSKIDSELGQESLERLQRSIEHADVEMIESHGNVQYKNRSLDNLVLPLLRSLKLQHLGYTAWKIVTALSVQNRTGPLYIIPILPIPETDPRLSTGEKLCPGSYVYHDGRVDLFPGLTCLFVGNIPAKDAIS